MRKPTSLALVLAVIVTSAFVAQARVADQWQLSFPVHVEGAGLVVAPGSVVQFDAVASSSVIDALIAGSQNSVDAFERLDDGRYFFSLTTHVDTDGLVISPADVVLHDNGTVSLALDGSAAGVPDGVAIDAVSLADNGDLLVSLDRHAQLDGAVYAPGDIIGFDGNVFYPHLNAQAIGLADGVNLVGLTRVVGDQHVVTLDRAFELAGEAVYPGDVVLLSADGTMRSRVYQASVSFDTPAGLSGLSATPAPQELFSDRFDQP